MASYGALWRARFQLMRPGNAAMAGVGVLIGSLLLSGQAAPAWPAMVAAVMITAFGNVMNDVTDRRIDATAHPGRPLPSGRIAVSSAKAFAVFLLGFGLIETLQYGIGPVLFFALANATLLVLYDLRLKRWPLVGNVAVGALVASTFAFGALAADITFAGQWMPRGWSGAGLWLVMAMVFLTNLARELLKDLEDAAGDVGRKTLPMLIGPGATGWLASLCIGAAVGIDASLVWAMESWSMAGRTVLAGAGTTFLVAGGLGCYQAGRGQRALKWAMLVALAGLLLAPLTFLW